MQYRTDQRSGNRLSVLGFGCMRFTRKNGVINQKKADAEMALALEKGVNYFDTAYLYPGSEECLGRFLQDHGCRDQVFIATKLPQFRLTKTEQFDTYFNEELQRLRTDHIDYYLMHMLNDAQSWQRLCSLGALEWVQKKKQSGQIRQIGFSFHGGTEQFKALVDAYDWDFCQIQFNYMDEYSQAGIEGLRYAAGKGLPVIIMEPLRGGKLAGGLPKAAREVFEKAQPQRTPVDWALRWIWNHPEVTVVLSGMNDSAQVEENCRIAEESLPGHLTAEELGLYPRVLEAVRANTHVGCTGCGYCQPCPRGVDIPTCFALYNGSYTDGYVNSLREYFMCTTLRKVRSNAGLCVKCGRCEQHCPQHIDIRDELQHVKRRFENPVYRIGAAAAPWIMRY